MQTIKTIFTAAAFAALTATAAGAASWDHDRDPRDVRPGFRHEQIIRHDVRRDLRFEDRREIVQRERVFDTLRLHRYRSAGNPAFVRGHYVVRSFDHRGRIVFVEVDPYTGRLIGEFRI